MGNRLAASPNEPDLLAICVACIRSAQGSHSCRRNKCSPGGRGEASQTSLAAVPWGICQGLWGAWGPNLVLLSRDGITVVQQDTR